jgi:glyoxylate utilization-related uncharacterized protein
VSDEPFVANVRDLPWVHSSTFGSACVFESDDRRFPFVGYTLAVLEPGQPSDLYHRENTQEDFLVLRGACVLLLEGEERRLGVGDFVHCPPGAEHIFVGAGVERETASAQEAYAPFERWQPGPPLDLRDLL